ncbi:MAG: hypothetical protein ACK4YP_02605 [Myxococcota bacterium]
MEILLISLSGLCCCMGFFLLLFLVVGLLFLRKRGKKDISPQEAVKVGAEQVSQMFVRPKKSREELMREEDEEERRR